MKKNKSFLLNTLVSISLGLSACNLNTTTTLVKNNEINSRITNINNRVNSSNIGLVEVKIDNNTFRKKGFNTKGDVNFANSDIKFLSLEAEGAEFSTISSIVEWSPSKPISMKLAVPIGKNRLFRLSALDEEGNALFMLGGVSNIDIGKNSVKFSYLDTLVLEVYEQLLDFIKFSNFSKLCTKEQKIEEEKKSLFRFCTSISKDNFGNIDNEQVRKLIKDLTAYDETNNTYSGLIPFFIQPKVIANAINNTMYDNFLPTFESLKANTFISDSSNSTINITLNVKGAKIFINDLNTPFIESNNSYIVKLDGLMPVRSWKLTIKKEGYFTHTQEVSSSIFSNNNFEISLSKKENPDSFEPDNSFDTASPISFDGSVQHRSFHDKEDVDYMKFTVKPEDENKVYRLQLFIESTGVSIIELYRKEDTSKSIMGSYQFFGLNTLKTALPRGDYYVKFYNGNKRTGTYSFSLTKAFPSPEGDLDNDGLTDTEEVKFSTNPNNPDTDGDGILDGWEVKPRNGLDLKSLGADPLNKDVFVYIDWMKGFEPDQTIFPNIKALFKEHNINVHIVMGKEIPFSEYLELESQDFLNLRNNNFPENMKGIFHYGVYANKFISSNLLGEAQGYTSEYFMIAKGSIRALKSSEEATFVHELGHCLGLTHGGSLNEIGRNYKPNYMSVMNYLYGEGIKSTLLKYSFATPEQANKFKEIDFSSGTMPDFDERNIIEANGLGLGIEVDWDLNNTIDVEAFGIDVNGDGNAEVLKDYNDWGNLSFDFNGNNLFTTKSTNNTKDIIKCSFGGLAKHK